MADELRKIARAYYERASEEERDEAKDLLTKLDLDEDERISLQEFKAGFDSSESGEEFFKKLDSDGDGFLRFSDFLVLFYHKKKAISISRCDGCNHIILGPYFTCVLCLDHYPRTFDLCSDCHRGNKFRHRHPMSFMLHDQVAFSQFVQTKIHQPKSEMEELRAIAEAHFRASSPKIQAKAKAFFDSMDGDGDGKVELSEYTSFMSQKGYKMTGTPEFFKKMDVDGDGSLDFWEVVTLSYIINSGRPFCDCCGDFIPATFFTCVNCFKNGKSFDLCLRCFNSGGFEHGHDGHDAQFLDNYTLLNKKQGSSSSLGLGRIDAAFSTLEVAVDIFSSF